MDRHEEIERKYDVDGATVMPALDEVAATRAAGESLLEAEYFDTEQGDLAAHRIVLRRRQGGADQGWHIKIPSPEGRTEFHWPLDDQEAGSRRVPAEVVDPVLVHVRDRQLRVVARIETRRAIIHLLDGTGEGIAEVADDQVTASDVARGVVRMWREWEVELLDAAPESPDERVALMDAVEQRLLAAGAVAAASGSKLATALGRIDLAEPTAHQDLGPASASSQLLSIVLSGLVDELKLLDPKIRSDEPDSIHQARTRIRRVRSLLASFDRVLDGAATEGVRGELRHLGEVLGEARDAEVMRDRARDLANRHGDAALAAAPHSAVAAESAAAVDELSAGWSEAYGAAHARVLEELSSERYFRLLDSLDELVERPVLGEDAFASIEFVAAAALDRGLKRVLRRAKRARAAATEPDRIELLHDVRKAAKRLRYTAEAVSQGRGAVLGRKVRSLASAAEAVHDLLGEHRDSMLMQDHLRAAARGSVHAFEYGVLHEVERHSAALCLAEYPGALRRLKNRPRA